MENEAMAMAADEMQPMMEKAPSEKAMSQKAMSEKAMSQKAMSEKAMEEMQMSERHSTKASEDDINENDYCRCMCCLCHCSDPSYADLTCLGCFPVKCGIITVGLFAIALTVLIFAETFTMLMSDTIAWWYVGVSVLLQIPLIIGLIFFLNFFGEDNNDTRKKLDTASMLAIISFSLQIVWNISYFWGLYRQNNITIGQEDSINFTVTKKQYLFWSTFFYLLVIFAYGYFICVCRRYWYRLKPSNSDNKDEDDMEKNKNN